jgi:hypothetical protein
MQRLFSIVLTLVLACSLSLQASEPSTPSETPSKYTWLCLTGAYGTGLYKAGKYGYQRLSKSQMAKKLEQKIIEQAVDDLYLALTRNSTIAAIEDEQERNEKFCKKAQLIQLRKNVLKKIKSKANSSTLELSYLHQWELKNKFLTPIMKLFATLDQLRGQVEEPERITMLGILKSAASKTEIGQQLLVKNPCETGEITVPEGTLFAQMLERLKSTVVEDAIVNSILLQYKPAKELTAEDRAKKEESAKRRQQVLVLFKEKIKSGPIDKVLSMTALVSLFVAMSAIVGGF